MKATEYKRLRKHIGSQFKAAKILGVTIASISRRESGRNRITREAELAMRWAALTTPPSADLVNIARSTRRKR